MQGNSKTRRGIIFNGNSERVNAIKDCAVVPLRGYQAEFWSFHVSKVPSNTQLTLRQSKCAGSLNFSVVLAACCSLDVIEVIFQFGY